MLRLYRSIRNWLPGLPRLRSIFPEVMLRGFLGPARYNRRPRPAPAAPAGPGDVPMSNEPQGSVTHWIGALKAGDDEAAQRLWERYFDELVRLARAKLGGLPRGEADEEDVALSAFHSFCRGAARGRFPRLDDRHDLWPLLVTITARKVLDQAERLNRKKRGGGRVRGESDVHGGDPEASGTGLDRVVGREPTPAFAAMVTDECRRLLEALGDETLRRIALLRMEGYNDPEIAARLGCGLRTVGRKLELIRKTLGARGGDVNDEALAPASGSLPLTLAGRIDRACDRYEADWKAGRRPRIEAYLADTPEPDRSVLLRELLLLELEFRRNDDERPTAGEYQARFPRDEPLIRSAFEAVARLRDPDTRPEGKGRANADRNLLFGILAGRVGLASRDALVTPCMPGRSTSPDPSVRSSPNRES